MEVLYLLYLPLFSDYYSLYCAPFRLVFSVSPFYTTQFPSFELFLLPPTTAPARNTEFSLLELSSSLFFPRKPFQASFSSTE